MRRQKCVMACAAPLHVVGCRRWSMVIRACGHARLFGRCGYLPYVRRGRLLRASRRLNRGNTAPLQYTGEAAAITIRARSGQLKEAVPVYARTLLRCGGPQGCRLGRWSASPRLLPPPVSRPPTSRALDRGRRGSQ
jgi:hypothetical protein